MTRSKKFLQKHLMMLKCFRSAHSLALAKGVSSIYEAHILMSTVDGNMSKVFRFFLGGQVLPTVVVEYQDMYITLLTPQKIKEYVEECEKYGI